MSCLKCEERAKLLNEALAAFHAGDKTKMAEKIQAVIKSGVADVKMAASMVINSEARKGNIK